MKLKTIVSVIPSPPVEELQSFCKEADINLIHISGPKAKDPLAFHIEPSVFSSIVEVSTPIIATYGRSNCT